MLLQAIAQAMHENHPEVSLMVLLIDERPEEVTDMVRSVQGEVVSSTFDDLAARAGGGDGPGGQAPGGGGKDVVMLLDSVTRLARAYNAVQPTSGASFPGASTPTPCRSPSASSAPPATWRRGSLTILATALIDTGSRMDDVIFEEFKGTGNMEVNLDRKLADRRVFPAVDLLRSGTRKELLLSDKELNRAWVLRKVLQQMSPVEAMELLREKMTKTRSNAEFLESMAGWRSAEPTRRALATASDLECTSSFS